MKQYIDPYSNYTCHFPHDFYIDLSKYEVATIKSKKTRYRAHNNQLIATIIPTVPVAEVTMIEE